MWLIYPEIWLQWNVSLHYFKDTSKIWQPYVDYDWLLSEEEEQERALENRSIENEHTFRQSDQIQLDYHFKAQDAFSFRTQKLVTHTQQTKRILRLELLLMVYLESRLGYRDL